MGRTLILGAGFGGLTAATELARLAPGHEVVLVDERASFLMGLSKLWMLDGRRRPGEGRRNLRDVERHGVRFVQAKVQALDISARTARVGEETLAWDHLVVALGASLAPQAIPGLAEAAHDLYDADGVEALHRELDAFSGGDVLFLVTALPFKCPPAPYEAAMLTQTWLRSRGVRARVLIASPEPQPLPVAGPECGATIKEYLAERGVEASFDKKPVRVDPAARTVHFEDGRMQRYDVLAAVPPHRPPALLKGSGLAGETGWLHVDARTMETAWPGVYGVGDCTFVKLANGKPLVKAGIMAEGEARVVAHRIAARLRGEAPTATFDGKGFCYLELGGELALEVQGDFYAQPNPIVAARPPSKAALQGKHAFEAERLARWFGA